MRRFLTLLFISFICTCTSTMLGINQTSGLRAQPTEAQIRNAIEITPHDSVRIRAYRDLLYQNLDNPERIQELLDTVEMYRDIVNTDFARAVWYNARAEIAFSAEDLVKAREIYRESIEDFKQRGNNMRIADQSYILSITYRNEGDYAAIFNATLEGLKYALKTTRYDMIGKMYNSMGICQRRMGDPDAAIRYYRLAVAAVEKIGDDRRLFSPVINLASLYGDKSIMDSSLYYYQLAETIANRQQPPNREQLGYIYNNLTRIYLKQEKNEQALTIARKAYSQFQGLGNIEREQAAAASNVANALVALDRHAESLPYQYEVRDFAMGESEKPEDRRDVFLQLARSYAALGRTDSLAAQYEEVLTLTDSITASDQRERILEMDGKYQNSVKQAEIDRLSLEDQLSQVRIGRQQAMIAGGLLLLGLLGGFLYFLLQQRRRIQAQNDTITKSLGEKETLLKEIHHRVKNNLQMVSSLLSLQSDYIEDDAALDAIEMGRQRVRSMAIIHQRLYLRDEVTTAISARDYLDQLIGELMGALNVKGLALELDKQLEDIDIDIDRMIPLGLVANEVITNAMKHAFTGRESGRLEVHFRRLGENVELVISDDGHGIEAGFTGQEDSFGNLLIRTFAEQLEGELMVENEGGTRVRLSFPEAV